MIQVLGLRDNKSVPGRKREVFFGNNWRFEKVQDVFSESILNELLEKVPKDERYNLYFTVAQCFEEKGRKLQEQWAIPFDIDDIHINSEETIFADAQKVASEAINVLGLHLENCAVVFSGHGVQFFVLLDSPILSVDYFDNLRDHYIAVCDKIQQRLNEKNIKGKVDTSVFSAARLMRLPNTDNRKPDKPTRRAVIINSNMSPVGFDLTELSGIIDMPKSETLSEHTLKNYPKPDTKAICEGCDFLKHCKSKPNDISEPAWYKGMISILSRLENGRELVHEYSEGHASYSHYETEHKIDQSLKRAGPALCTTIGALWDGCPKCPNYGSVISPIVIRGPDYIMTEGTGFRKMRQTEDGRVVPGKVEYEDLIKKFKSERPYRTLASTEQVIIHDGVKWSIFPDVYIKQWTTERVRPAPSASEMSEFITRLKAYSVAHAEWAEDTTHQKLNFKNCVLDTATGEVFPHSPDFGFFNVLPFDYDKYAKAPTWEKFLTDICSGDQAKMDVIEEFAGYCISGDSCWLEKALLLVGDGANGKSTFMETLGNVVGANNRSSVPFQDLEKDTKKYLLVNKLFNYSEETSSKALFESSTFKNLVSGGMMSVKQLYLQEYEVKNRTKFILAANEMPYSTDRTHGFLRRLIIVKLTRQFDAGTEEHDPFIKEKLNAELSGICNRLITAYNKLKNRKRLNPAYDNDAITRAYAKESNNVARFNDECVRADASSSVGVMDMYNSYVAYCEMNGEKALSNIRFAKLFKKENPGAETRTIRRVDKTTRVYAGVSLIEERNF